MKPTTNNPQLKEMFRIKQVHMDEIKRIERHTQMLRYVIAGCVGASITLAAVIVHMMVKGPSWTW
jgi:hypothetical protein